MLNDERRGIKCTQLEKKTNNIEKILLFDKYPNKKNENHYFQIKYFNLQRKSLRLQAIHLK